jgi:hypothetical protein
MRLSMLDEERHNRLKRDAQAAPAYVATMTIRVHYDGTMSMDAPLGDKALCLTMLDQARDAVNANGKDRGWLLTPAGYGDAKARPEGYS